MQSVMNQCKFLDGEYTPSSDSEVNSIRVEAERPALPEGADATLVNSSLPSSGINTGFIRAIAVAVACVVAFMA